MITAMKAARFANRAQSKTLGSIDITSATQKAEADLTRDIRRTADFGRMNTKFPVRSLPVAEVLLIKLKDNGYRAALEIGSKCQMLTIDWTPDEK